MMLEYIGLPAMLEQTAEECAELTKAALAAVNPQGENAIEAQADLEEEYTDVLQCGEELGLTTYSGAAMHLIRPIAISMTMLHLAEESADFGKAALKLARIIRKENPTPITKEEAEIRLREQYDKVVFYGAAANLKYDQKQKKEKQQRFLHRWQAAGKEKTENK